MMNQINIVKHMFQIALTNELDIPVVVYIGQVHSKSEVVMVRQSTLDEWSMEYNTTGPNPVMWVQAKVYLPPSIIQDAETLTETYLKMRNKILETLKSKGGNSSASSF